VYYTRSADLGRNWSTPIDLSTDGNNREQWMPSLTVTSRGAVLVSWYDRRNSPDMPSPSVTHNPQVYSYQYWGRVSSDNGVIWQSSYQISNITISEPLDDPTIMCLQGEYYSHFASEDAGYFT